MKNSMFKAIATLACAAALTACGGGAKNNDTTPLPPQPAYAVVVDSEPGGSAPVVAAGDLVTFSYTGWLYNEAKTDKKGDEFESSVTSGVDKPMTMTVGVGTRIAGLDKALTGMQVGGSRLVIIPSNMAFGPVDVKDSTGKVIVPANTSVVYQLNVHSFSTLPSPIPPQPVFTKQELQVGSGAAAAAKNLVTIQYRGWLYDNTKPDNKGTEFLDKYSGQPFSFLLGVDSRIAGWDQGIVGMQVGGKRRLLIPANMAWAQYGRKDDAGNYIVPPSTAVVYEIEMTALNATPPAQTAQPAFDKIIVAEGAGDASVTGNTLTVSYSGYLYDDSVTDKRGLRFDTSLTKGVPMTVKLGANVVIKGWEDGLLGMKAGGKRTLIIPASMGYGATGQGSIPANAPLIFDVEVTSITK
ncbi:FKBP-type peptidyl-prolyl cis-trans isomerase [Pseudoduganella sp. S-14]|uniref:FKBP-type peptidyl-prolyl cis-trans isomerase n=1 Tax=Pseudoduganella sp. S-14 TaxID=3404065 RepID=UPI003CF9EF81